MNTRQESPSLLERGLPPGLRLPGRKAASSPEVERAAKVALQLARAAARRLRRGT